MGSLTHHSQGAAALTRGCSGIPPPAVEQLFPTSFTDLCVCRVVSLTYSHSSLQLHLLLCSSHPRPLLKYVISVASGLSLSQQQVHLGAGWQWLCRIEGKLLATTYTIYPCSSPATKTLPHKLNTHRRIIIHHCLTRSSVIISDVQRHSNTRRGALTCYFEPAISSRVRDI